MAESFSALAVTWGEEWVDNLHTGVVKDIQSKTMVESKPYCKPCLFLVDLGQITRSRHILFELSFL